MSKDTLSHYGTPRHSGRYPWGSGNDPKQRNQDFLGFVDDLKKKGMSESQIAKAMRMPTTQLRAKKSIAKMEKRKADTALALSLKGKGMNNVDIGKQMGINESSVRALLDPALKARNEVTNATANMLKEAVAKKGLIDVGAGSEFDLHVSRTKLQTSLALLKEEGYTTNYVYVTQLGTGKQTSLLVLAPPGMDYKTVYANRDNIKTINDYHTEDGGRTWYGIEYPKSIASDRVKIRYAEEGGKDKDGVIELRRGVEDISLGNSKYAQVRIAVDGTHYLKGMAMYSDNMPEGYDIVFNTNKHSNKQKMEVLKPMKRLKNGEIDPDNPFGASIKRFTGQRHYKDADGKDQLSCINKVNEEGDWGEWSRSLSSQMLSKQPVSLAKKQLGLAYDIKKEEFDEICALDNPTVKKFLLSGAGGTAGFAADCDSSAVHLKAAAMPRQSTKVILPLPNMKENEVYAPTYRDGESVVLIRHPHGGTFEIPELVVNNRNKEAKSLLGQTKDAIGIHPKVAERLSGADFDGDNVIVIPNNGRSIKTSQAIKDLINFDPKESYPAYEGMPKVAWKNDKWPLKQMEMGKASNLITDMTIKGASVEEITKAVKHSMVIIDAEKHNLNYKQSYIDNGIAALKKKYQTGPIGGASTLISRASSEKDIRTRKVRIDPETGKKIYEYTNKSFVGKDGKVHFLSSKSTKMYETEDAFTLSSGTPMEDVYATHANKLKALGNEARKLALATKPIKYSPTANKFYAKEVASLQSQLKVSLRNAPRERQALILANAVIKAKKADNPDMTKEDLKKAKGQALAEARARTGAKKQQIVITDREWEAIQSGAISNNVLLKILNNTDLDAVKKLANPRETKTGMSPAREARAKAMLEAGHTQAEIADALGVSTAAVSDLLGKESNS